MSEKGKPMGKWYWQARKWRERARHWKRVAEGWCKIYDEETIDLYVSEREIRPPSETYRLQVKALEADRARVQLLFQRAGFAGVDPKTDAPAVMVTLAKWNELGEAIAGEPVEPKEIEK